MVKPIIFDKNHLVRGRCVITRLGTFQAFGIDYHLNHRAERSVSWFDNNCHKVRDFAWSRR